MKILDSRLCAAVRLLVDNPRIVVKEKNPEEIAALRKAKKRIRKPRKGLYQCAGCRKQFSVTVKTIFEDSHIPLHKWLMAAHLMCASKKGISADQLMRMLDIKQYKSALVHGASDSLRSDRRTAGEDDWHCRS